MSDATSPRSRLPSPGLTEAEVEQGGLPQGRRTTRRTPNSRSLRSIIPRDTSPRQHRHRDLVGPHDCRRAPFQDSLFGTSSSSTQRSESCREYRAKRTLEKLSLIGEAKPIVRRGGDREVTADDIVLDDLVVLNGRPDRR